MEPVRFGELIASMAWALVHDATPQEVDYICNHWREAGTMMLLATRAADDAKGSSEAIISKYVSHAKETFGEEVAGSLEAALHAATGRGAA